MPRAAAATSVYARERAVYTLPATPCLFLTLWPRACVLCLRGVHQVLAALSSAVAADGRGVDVVLMDIEMARMDGVSAVQAMRRAGWAAPVIAVTGNADPGDGTTCARRRRARVCACVVECCVRACVRHVRAFSRDFIVLTHTCHSHAAPRDRPLARLQRGAREALLT